MTVGEAKDTLLVRGDESLTEGTRAVGLQGEYQIADAMKQNFQQKKTILSLRQRNAIGKLIRRAKR